MRKIILIAASALCVLSCQRATLAPGFYWQRYVVDGSRTGVKACTADNAKENLGTLQADGYHAPNGKVFKDGTTPKVAKILLDAQGEMKDIKSVVGYSPKAMVRENPQCELSNWYVDVLMKKVASLSGKKVDFGIVNFGGIRIDMPKGEVLKDDIMSMFPFKNNLCYVEVKGKDLRVLLEQLAKEKWQVTGGCECVVKDSKLEKCLIGGEPIDDNRNYGIATISFLLSGGDGLSVAKNALSMQIFDVYPYDVMLEEVARLKAEGKEIAYHKDDRIKILKSEDEDNDLKQ